MTAGDGAPPLLTERDEEIVADCAFAAQIMLAWWAGEPITVNRAEREALARDGDFAEGHEAATWVGLRASTKARYGWSAHLLEGSWAEVMALPADAYCVLFGKYDRLTKHFRRWDTFTGLHAVGYRPSDGWWQDPETLPGAIAGGFSGETIPASVARTYAEGWPDGQVHALWMTRGEITMNRLPVGNRTPGAMADLPKGIELFSAPEQAFKETLYDATVPALFYTGTGYIAVEWAHELVLVKNNPPIVVHAAPAIGVQPAPAAGAQPAQGPGPQPAPAGPALDVAALVAAAAADHEQTIADLTDRLAKIDALARGPNDQP